MSAAPGDMRRNGRHPQPPIAGEDHPPRLCHLVRRRDDIGVKPAQECSVQDAKPSRPAGRSEQLVDELVCRRAPEVGEVDGLLVQLGGGNAEQRPPAESRKGVLDALLGVCRVDERRPEMKPTDDTVSGYRAPQTGYLQWGSQLHDQRKVPRRQTTVQSSRIGGNVVALRTCDELAQPPVGTMADRPHVSHCGLWRPLLRLVKKRELTLVG